MQRGKIKMGGGQHYQGYCYDSVDTILCHIDKIHGQKYFKVCGEGDDEFLKCYCKLFTRTLYAELIIEEQKENGKQLTPKEKRTLAETVKNQFDIFKNDFYPVFLRLIKSDLITTKTNVRNDKQELKRQTLQEKFTTLKDNLDPTIQDKIIRELDAVVKDTEEGKEEEPGKKSPDLTIEDIESSLGEDTPENRTLNYFLNQLLSNGRCHRELSGLNQQSSVLTPHSLERPTMTGGGEIFFWGAILVIVVVTAFKVMKAVNRVAQRALQDEYSKKIKNVNNAKTPADRVVALKAVIKYANDNAGLMEFTNLDEVKQELEKELENEKTTKSVGGRKKSMRRKRRKSFKKNTKKRTKRRSTKRNMRSKCRTFTKGKKLK